MKHKKLLALLLAMAMVLGTLAGCGDKGGDETTTKAPAKETEAPGTEAPGTEASGTEAPTEEPTPDYSMYKVTEPIKITFWHAVKSNDAFWQEMVNEFNKLSGETLVTVEAKSVGSMPNCKNQLDAAHQARQGIPAVVTINVPATPKYFESGVITDISTLMAANGYSFDNLLDGLVNQVTVGDSIIAMPWGCTATVYFYNRTELAKHNLDQFPTTWDGFKTWVKDVFVATGKPAVTMDGTNGNFFYNLLLNFGGDMMKADDPTKTAYDNDNLIKRMKELKELVNAGYVEWSIEGKDLIANKWLNGDTMTLNVASDYYQNYLKTMTELPEEEKFEIGLAWTFGETYDYSTVAGTVLCVTEEISQEEKNAAAVFLNWLSTPERDAAWATYTSQCMIYKENINDSELIDKMYAELPETKVAIYPYMEDHYVMKPQTEYYDAINTEMMSAVQEIFLGGEDFDTRWALAIEQVEYILNGN